MNEQYSAHRQFLNRYYGKVKGIYDLTRRYFLFGRNRALADLIADPNWHSLVEIGLGTGRNLVMLQAKRPDARYGGIEASDEMLDFAQKRCPWASLQHGFAETADIAAVLGTKPDRILFSYSLSMMINQEQALKNAQRSLSATGEVWLVDFADADKLWPPFADWLTKFLRAFHVVPIGSAFIQQWTNNVIWGTGRYYLIARLPPLSDSL